MEHYGRCVELDPSQEEALANLGAVLCQLGRPGEGIGYLNRALELDPTDAVAMRNRARAQAEVMAGRSTEEKQMMEEPHLTGPDYLIGAAQNWLEQGDAPPDVARFRDMVILAIGQVPRTLRPSCPTGL